jgi:hypothetical protein
MSLADLRRAWLAPAFGRHLDLEASSVHRRRVVSTSAARYSDPVAGKA